MKKQLLSEKVRRALLQLNLTEKEISIYVCLLGNGALSVQEIFRSANINRVTVYASIETLKQKGLVSESRRGKRKLFVAEDPDRLAALLDYKQEALRREKISLDNVILPVLKAVDVNQKNKPEFKFFEGEDGINRVYDEYILNHCDVINCGSYETAQKAITLEEEKGYFEDIRKRKSLYRVILEDTPLNRKFAKASRGIIHTKFLPEGTRVTADIAVAGKITVLISYDRLTATVIEDDAIAASMKVYLDFMWENL